MELMVALLMLTMSVVQVGSFGQIMCDDDDDDSDVDKGVIDIMDDNDNANDVQVGSCGKNQVCAQEEEEELMGKTIDTNLKQILATLKIVILMYCRKVRVPVCIYCQVRSHLCRS